jgi:lipoprotein-anchoring transpeptidase ErfK/SrfK
VAGDDRGSGYDTPGGTFKPFRMEIDHYSDEYDNAPMPYSIFFTQTGNAIHGTYEQRNRGRAVSHGCVRLSVKNANVVDFAVGVIIPFVPILADP